jgi:hypothetical protein
MIKGYEIIDNVVQKTITVDEGLIQWETEANKLMDQFHLKYPTAKHPTIEY